MLGGAKRLQCCRSVEAKRRRDGTEIHVTRMIVAHEHARHDSTPAQIDYPIAFCELRLVWTVGCDRLNSVAGNDHRGAAAWVDTIENVRVRQYESRHYNSPCRSVPPGAVMGADTAETVSLLKPRAPTSNSPKSLARPSR